MRDYNFIQTITDPEMKVAVYRELGKTDLYFFCKYILGYKELETQTNIHYALCEILDNEPLRYTFLLFRGAFKTSIAMAKVLQWLCKNRNERIGYGSDVRDRATDVTKDIRDIAANNSLLKSLYPEVFYVNPENESDLWRMEAFNVKQDERGSVSDGYKPPSVMSFGLDPLPTGKHFTKVMFDDTENEQNQDNPDLNTKLLRNFSLFFPIPNPQAPIYLWGTIYSGTGPHTLYQKKWPTYKRRIIDKYGNPTFPSRFPMEVIERMKDETDSYTWDGQYLLIAPRKRDNLFYPFAAAQINKFNFKNGVIEYGN